MLKPSSPGLFFGPEGLLRRHAAGLSIAALAGAGGGAATVALLALINETLNRDDDAAAGLALAFLGLAVLTLAGRALADALTNRIGQDVVRGLRLTLARRILAAPIDELERFRTHRLVPVLSHDVSMVSNLCLSLPYTVVAGTVLVGCLLWLLWLSWQLASLLVVLMALAIVVHTIALRRALKRFEAAREREDDLQKAWRKLGDAAKELRLSRGRRRQFYADAILRNVDDIRSANVKAGDVLSFAHELGAAMYFLFIAAIFSAAKFWRLPAEVLSGFVLALLYLKGPMDQVLGFLPFLARARVSIGRVNELSERFANPERGLGELDGHATATPQFGQVIELRDVRYAYQADAGEQAFVLGPLSMCIHRGEILFISGDNGSGKTTFLKILTGLYIPQAGEMLLDGVRVDAGNRDAYRQLFSPVLSDFHLFEELAEDAIVGPDKREEVARAGLERLALASKVAVKDGRFSTTDLSTGQRKRLALVHAWVEARPVMVFDEWAADQDPTFRHEFYTQLLPELRAQGHTLVVISHDDRYFGVADRVVDFRDGRVLGAAQNGESALLTAAGHA